MYYGFWYLFMKDKDENMSKVVICTKIKAIKFYF